MCRKCGRPGFLRGRSMRGGWRQLRFSLGCGLRGRSIEWRRADRQFTVWSRRHSRRCGRSRSALGWSRRSRTLGGSDIHNRLGWGIRLHKLLISNYSTVPQFFNLNLPLTATGRIRTRPRHPKFCALHHRTHRYRNRLSRQRWIPGRRQRCC